MRAKWAESTIKTTKIPSIRTILLVVLLVGAVTVIAGVSIAVQNEAPRSVAPPVPAEGPAAWLSAWSTFWGAFATALGAALTAGALLIAALTFRRQVADRRRELRRERRAHANCVSIIRSKVPNEDNSRDIEVRNDSSTPISWVRMFSIHGDVVSAPDNAPTILPPGGQFKWKAPKAAGAWVEFYDVWEQKWRRRDDGRLQELDETISGL